MAGLANAVITYVPLLTLTMTIFLAWYVNYAVKKRLYREELNERRLSELYRPMDMVLKASKSAFQRHPSATNEERVFIAELWHDYNEHMKELLMKNSHLIIEPDVPSEVVKLLEHIDAYMFDYEQFRAGKIPDPFPAKRGYPFPDEVNEYFDSNSRKLVERLEPRQSFLRRHVHFKRRPG